MSRYPRVIAICVIRRGDQVLVGEGFDRVKDQVFHRPLGGSVEWREPAADAIVREFKEEMGLDLKDVRLLGTLENMFTFEDEEGHEIVMVYDGRFPTEDLYLQESFECAEDNGLAFRAVWRSLDGPNVIPLYPDGLQELLRASASQG